MNEWPMRGKDSNDIRLCSRKRLEHEDPSSEFDYSPSEDQQMPQTLKWHIKLPVANLLLSDQPTATLTDNNVHPVIVLFYHN